MLFTIITISYNSGSVIERTFQSVAIQTCTNFEYVLIDGASTDDTMILIDKYKSLFSTIISEPDLGLYHAMNKGLLHARGTYVWFLNAGDELYSSTTLAELEQLNINKDADVIYGETDLKDINGLYLAPRRLKAPKDLSWKSFQAGMLVCHQAFVLRRELAEDYNLEYKYSADFDWCIRAMKKSKLILNSKQTLCFYLNEGLTTKNQKASLKERFKIMTKHYGWLSTIIWHVWFLIRNSWYSVQKS